MKRLGRSFSLPVDHIDNVGDWIGASSEEVRGENFSHSVRVIGEHKLATSQFNHQRVVDCDESVLVRSIETCEPGFNLFLVNLERYQNLLELHFCCLL